MDIYADFELLWGRVFSEKILCLPSEFSCEKFYNNLIDLIASISTLRNYENRSKELYLRNDILFMVRVRQMTFDQNIVSIILSFIALLWLEWSK